MIRVDPGLEVVKYVFNGEDDLQGGRLLRCSQFKYSSEGTGHVRLDHPLEVTISDFDETWYNRCPIWEYEITQV